MTFQIEFSILLIVGFYAQKLKKERKMENQLAWALLAGTVTFLILVFYYTVLGPEITRIIYLRTIKQRWAKGSEGERAALLLTGHVSFGIDSEGKETFSFHV